MEENNDESAEEEEKEDKKENIELERSDILALIIATFWYLLPIILFSIVLVIIAYIFLSLMT